MWTYLTKNANLQLLCKLQIPNCPLSTIIFTLPSTSLSQAEGMNYDGISTFEDLNVADASVGDVRVYA